MILGGGEDLAITISVNVALFQVFQVLYREVPGFTLKTMPLLFMRLLLLLKTLDKSIILLIS